MIQQLRFVATAPIKLMMCDEKLSWYENSYILWTHSRFWSKHILSDDVAEFRRRLDKWVHAVDSFDKVDKIMEALYEPRLYVFFQSGAIAQLTDTKYRQGTYGPSSICIRLSDYNGSIALVEKQEWSSTQAEVDAIHTSIQNLFPKLESTYSSESAIALISNIKEIDDIKEPAQQKNEKLDTMDEIKQEGVSLFGAFSNNSKGDENEIKD